MTGWAPQDREGLQRAGKTGLAVSPSSLRSGPAIGAGRYRNRRDPRAGAIVLHDGLRTSVRVPGDIAASSRTPGRMGQSGLALLTDKERGLITVQAESVLGLIKKLRRAYQSMAYFLAIQAFHVME